MNKKVLNYFKKSDPVLFCAIKSFHKDVVSEPVVKKDLFSSLCRIITGQQLSGRAADSIWNRFKTSFPNNKPTAIGVIRMSELELRGCGFSYSKIRSLKDLSERVHTRSLRLNTLRKVSAGVASEQLQNVIGIGPWSSEMFLMFALGHEDVFSTGDLGLRKGIQKIYKYQDLPNTEVIEELSKKWSPYKTYAACAIWTILDNR